jgi:hypothetical protein
MAVALFIIATVFAAVFAPWWATLIIAACMVGAVFLEVLD